MMHLFSLPASSLSIVMLVSLLSLSPLAYADFVTGVALGSALSGKTDTPNRSEANEVITYTYGNQGTHKHIFSADKWKPDESGKIRICPGEKAVYRHYRFSDQTRCVVPRDGVRGFMGSMMRYPDVSLEDYLRMTTGKEPNISSIEIVQNERPSISVTYTTGEEIDASEIRYALDRAFNAMHQELNDKANDQSTEWLDIHWTSLCIGLAFGVALVRFVAVITSKAKREEDEWISKRQRTVGIKTSARGRSASSSHYQSRSRGNDDGLAAGIVVGTMMSDSTPSDTSSGAGCDSD